MSVIAANEPTMLATLTNAISKQDGTVNNLRIVNRQLDFVEVLIDVEVRDIRHLSAGDRRACARRRGSARWSGRALEEGQGRDVRSRPPA